MLKKFCILAVAVALAAPALAPAQGKKTPPTVVMRVKSIDALIQSVKVLSKVVDKAEFGNQLPKLIENKVGPKGLAGVDTKRPIGFYAKGSDLSDAAAVLMIPIKNKKDFLRLLKSLDYPAQEDAKKKGLYIVDQTDAPVEIGFRFANKYAYVTGYNLEAINKDRLLSPAQVFPRKHNALLSGTIRVNQIPKTFRDLAITKLEEDLKSELDNKIPAELPPSFKKFFQAALQYRTKVLADILIGATEVSVAVDVDAKKKKISTITSVDGRRTSQIKALFQRLGAKKSLFGALAKSNSGMAGLVNYQLPPSLRKEMPRVVDDFIALIVKKEDNKKKAEQARLILTALKPSFAAGELDAGMHMAMTGNGKLTVVAGWKIKNGKEIVQTARKIVAKAPPGDRDNIKFDAAKFNGVSIHRLDAQKSFDDKARKILGNNPVYVAIRDDAIFAAAGEGGMAALKKALGSKAQAAPIVHFQAHLAPFLRIVDNEKVKTLAGKIFGKGDKGTVRLTIRGGATLTSEFDMSLSVLELAVKSNLQPAEINFHKPRLLPLLQR